MSSTIISRWGFVRLLCLAALAAGLLHARGGSGDLKLDVRLVWGANEDRSPNPKHKKLDGEVAKKLRKIFKWKNYFECYKEEVDVVLNGSRRIKLSDRCTIEVKFLGNSRIDVYLFGEGKFINRTSHSLPRGDWLMLAGDDKNDTAWFVVIKQVE